MKYIVILGDGMADYPCAVLNGKTPLELAKKPTIDRLAMLGEVGTCQTVPFGLKPGSDVANLSVMGYAPEKYYTGRSPLEALSMGIALKDNDVAVRCNLVTLSDEADFTKKTMLDYSAGEISTEEARALILAVSDVLKSEKYAFFPGVSYRHCMVAQGGTLKNELTPPHDISDKVIGKFLPMGETATDYLDMMVRSGEILKNHPINQNRIAVGKKPATHIWLWGAGTKPFLPAFSSLYGIKGGVISAVDLLKGIAVGANMAVIDVPGATGNLQTNFKGKAQAALDALKGGLDYIYLHIEAPDECGHQGDAIGKIRAIEMVDEVVKLVEDGLRKAGEPFTILITPDHGTPLCKKTHVSDPVPFAIYRSDNAAHSGQIYTEKTASLGKFIPSGEDLMKFMLKR